MGIIIQEMVYADYSGILFSSNYHNSSKKEMLMTYVEGLGDNLVSGRVGGTEVCIKCTTSGYYEVDVFVPFFDILQSLCEKVKLMEEILGFPIDVEWSIIGDTILFLQCRPITGIFVKHEGLVELNVSSLKNIDPRFLNMDKVDLRQIYQFASFVPKGYIFSLNTTHEHIRDMLNLTERSKFCDGYTVVVTYPHDTFEWSVKTFIGDGKNFEKYVTCHRFKVRAFPNYNELQNCIENIYGSIKPNYWSCSLLIQENIRYKFTGRIRKDGRA